MAAMSVAMSAGISSGITIATNAHTRMAHTTICISATSPTPIILPNISCMGLTDDTISSSTRLFFSSIMEFITIWPYSSRNV